MTEKSLLYNWALIKTVLLVIVKLHMESDACMGLYATKHDTWL